MELNSTNASAITELAGEYLRASNVPHFFVGGDLKILGMNDAAQAFFSQQSALNNQNGHISVRGNEKQASLSDLVKHRSVGHRICLNCEFTKKHVLVDLVALVGHAIVLTARLVQSLDINTYVLTGAFGFTATEISLVRAIFQGMGPQDIADKMGVSINTFRSHIRNIYAKLSVSSREGMVNRLLPYILP